jgi:two-component system response regulator RegA
VDDERSTLLLVDDDDAFRRVLARALERRGYAVTVAISVDMAHSPRRRRSRRVRRRRSQDAWEKRAWCLIEKLIELDPNTRVVMLTGYASIATAIEAIKLGAIHYLAKPCDADEVVAALNKSSEGDSAMPVSVRRCRSTGSEWEHIQRVLAEHQGNISATARSLKMHRRTLQRKLGKHPARESQ